MLLIIYGLTPYFKYHSAQGLTAYFSNLVYGLTVDNPRGTSYNWNCKEDENREFDEDDDTAGEIVGFDVGSY